MIKAEVYNVVYVMEDNKPTKKMVYSVTQQMSYYKRNVETVYRLVTTAVGASDDTAVVYPITDMYESVDALLNNLRENA